MKLTLHYPDKTEIEVEWSTRNGEQVKTRLLLDYLPDGNNIRTLTVSEIVGTDTEGTNLLAEFDGRGKV